MTYVTEFRELQGGNVDGSEGFWERDVNTVSRSLRRTKGSHMEQEKRGPCKDRIPRVDVAPLYSAPVVVLAADDDVLRKRTPRRQES